MCNQIIISRQNVVDKSEKLVSPSLCISELSVDQQKQLNEYLIEIIISNLNEVNNEKS